MLPQLEVPGGFTLPHHHPDRYVRSFARWARTSLVAPAEPVGPLVGLADLFIEKTKEIDAALRHPVLCRVPGRAGWPVAGRSVGESISRYVRVTSVGLMGPKVTAEWHPAKKKRAPESLSGARLITVRETNGCWSYRPWWCRSWRRCCRTACCWCQRSCCAGPACPAGRAHTRGILTHGSRIHRAGALGCCGVYSHAIGGHGRIARPPAHTRRSRAGTIDRVSDRRSIGATLIRRRADFLIRSIVAGR